MIVGADVASVDPICAVIKQNIGYADLRETGAGVEVLMTW